MIGTAAALLASGLAAAGASTAGAIMSNKSRTTTQTSTPELSPELRPLQDNVIGQIGSRLANPYEGLQPLKTAAIQGVNDSYSGVSDKIMQSFASRGLNNSGLATKALYSADIARAGDVAKLEPQFAQMAVNRGDNSISQALSLLASGRGVSSSQTTPNNSLGAGLMAGAQGGQSAIQDYLAYQNLQSILKNLNAAKT